MKVIKTHDDYCYAVPSLATSHICKKYQIIYKSVHSYLCTYMRNKYPWRSEFVGNVHIQVSLSFNFLKQYSANGTCLTSVNMQEYVNPL